MNLSMLDRLEASVARTLETVNRLQAENGQLSQQLAVLEKELRECRAANESLRIEHEQFKRSYDENAEWIARKDDIKSRIEQLLRKLDAPGS